MDREQRPRMTSRYIHATNSRGHIKTLAQIERQIIRLAVRRYGRNLSEVARRLGIGRSTLYRKMDGR